MLQTDTKIKRIFESDGGNILDLCCGQGRHSIFLAEKYPGLKLFAHDQSSYLISLAKERALNLPPQINRPVFTVGDCRSVPYDADLFDFVMIMGNSFGYFSANDHVEDQFIGQSITHTEDNVIESGDEAVLKEINRVLKFGGRMTLDLADGDYIRDNYSPRSWEWIDHQTFVCRERTLSKDKKRLHSREVIVSVSRGVVRDQFYSERLYGKKELLEYLKDAGFELEVQNTNDDPATNTVTAAKELSQRGQDLGMMEQRLLVTAVKVREHPKAKNSLPKATSQEIQHPFLSADNAQAVREWLDRLSPETFSGAPSKSSIPSAFPPEYVDLLKSWMSRLRETLVANKALPEDPNTIKSVISDIYPSIYHLLPPPPLPNDQLLIVMGDITLNCREKLNGMWNQEDHETRRKMIGALLSCGYKASQITILEKHNELVNYCATQPPAFTLNLCDEGFNNDALKELHVPALLEMCNVPYTGATPASLAICYDKGLVNSTAANIGVPTPKETYIIFAESLDVKEMRLDDIEVLVKEKESLGEITYPSFVKPMKGDNSLGITNRSIVNSGSDLATYIEYLMQTYAMKEFIVQEYLMGTEYSVGMIGNPETGFHFLPILQVDYSKIVKEGLDPILGWESKWDPESPYWTEVDFHVAPRIVNSAKKSQGSSTSEKVQVSTGGLTLEEEEQLKKNCAILFERFECRDYARFDWRADREVFWNVQTGEFVENPDSLSSQTPNEATNTLRTTSTNGNVDDVNTDDREDIEENSDSNSRRSGSGLSDSGRGSYRSSDTSNVNQSAVMETTLTSAKSSAERVKPKSLRQIKLLEVNPNPGWCWDGKMTKMAAQENKTYPDLLKSIMWAAWERIYGSELRSMQSKTTEQPVELK